MNKGGVADGALMEWTIRLARPGDAAAIHAIYAPIVIETAVSFELEPPSVEKMRQRSKTTLLTMPWLVCERDGVIGYAEANTFVTAADVSMTNSNQSPQPEGSRFDINGDTFTTPTDVSPANSHQDPPSAKPSGHATCAVCCPPLRLHREAVAGLDTKRRGQKEFGARRVGTCRARRLSAYRAGLRRPPPRRYGPENARCSPAKSRRST